MDQTLLDRFRDPAIMRWVPLSALKATEHLSCIDGRHDNCVIAAPGGDMGEFILLLVGIENVLNRALEQREIERALDLIMRHHLRFYMHTDEHALANLMTEIAADSAFTTLYDHDDTIRLTLRCPASLQDNLLAKLLNPNNVGCGALKMLLMDPESFEVPVRLTRGAISAFYRQQWAGSTAPILEVLWGIHEEEAVLNIVITGDEQQDGTHVPSVCGIDDGPSKLFINHRSARGYLRGENLRMFADHGVIHPEIDEDKVVDYCEALGTKHMDLILDALAPDLPRFDVVYDGHCQTPRIQRIKD